jgi:hypothetical protein
LWVSTVVPVADPPAAELDGAEVEGAELDEDAELGGADEPPDPDALLLELPQAARTTAAAANGKPTLPTCISGLGKLVFIAFISPCTGINPAPLLNSSSVDTGPRADEFIDRKVHYVTGEEAGAPMTAKMSYLDTSLSAAIGARTNPDRERCPKIGRKSTGS